MSFLPINLSQEQEAAAVEQMNNERKDDFNKKVYPHQIDLNCFPHGGDFLPNGYTSEELKLVNETRKIFNDEKFKFLLQLLEFL